MVSIALIERAAIGHACRFVRPITGKVFMALNILELLTFMVLTTISLNFKFVQIHCFYGLLVVVLSFHLYTYIKSKDIGSKLMVQSIIVLAGAAFVFNYPIVIHKWFNHRDLAHILMAIGSFIFLKGALNYEQLQTKKLETEQPPFS